MEFIPIVAAAALVWKLVDFVKFLSNWREHRSSVIAQLAVWLGGILVTLLLTVSRAAEGVDLGGIPIADWRFGDVLFFGLNLGSIASVGYDFKKARDDKDSAVTPPMVANTKTNANTKARAAY